MFGGVTASARELTRSDLGVVLHRREDRELDASQVPAAPGAVVKGLVRHDLGQGQLVADEAVHGRFDVSCLGRGIRRARA